MKIINAEVKNLEPIRTIAVSHTGDYSGIGAAFDKLAKWAEENNLWAAGPKVAAVYHDHPGEVPAEKLRSEACVENLSEIRPGEGMIEYTISGGRYFVMRVEVTMSEYKQAWISVYSAINEKGYQYDIRDHYELYVTMCDMEDPNATSIVDLCIPIK